MRRVCSWIWVRPGSSCRFLFPREPRTRSDIETGMRSDCVHSIGLRTTIEQTDSLQVQLRHSIAGLDFRSIVPEGVVEEEAHLALQGGGLSRAERKTSTVSPPPTAHAPIAPGSTPAPGTMRSSNAPGRCSRPSIMQSQCHPIPWCQTNGLPTPASRQTSR